MLQDGEQGAILQRDKQTYAVAPHIPCGVVTPDQLRRLADVAEKHDAAAMKITSAARIALVGLSEEQVPQVWQDLGMKPGAAVGICVRSIKACPGTTFCKRGTQDSLGLGMQLDEIFHGMELPGKCKIGVSGCMNQCAETGFKDIGLVGTPKGWRVLIGGCGGARPRVADVLAVDLSTKDAMAMIDRIIEYYRQTAKPKERLGRMIDRVGLQAVQQALVPV